MSRNPYRRILVVSMLLALIVVPMASARTVDSSSASRANGGDWLGAALRWVEDFVSPRPAGLHPSSSSHNVPQTKGGSTTNGGACIDPVGHPNPWCGM